MRGENLCVVQQAESGKLMNSPTIRLALGGSARIVSSFIKEGWSVCGTTVLPSLLLSYAYEKVWMAFMKPPMKVIIRKFVLDSGAFTAHAAGKTIAVEAYRDAVYRYRDMGVVPAELFSLDVIGDWRGSVKNTEYLWANGLAAIPAYHYGEPEDLLLAYARDYPKIALGGAVGIPRKEKERWARQCFARVWPKPIHGFGFGMWAVDVLPFHSIDCSDWECRAARFGCWHAFNGAKLGLGGGTLLDNLGCEAQVWLEAEHRARKKWASTFSKLNWPEDIGYPFLTQGEQS